MRKHLLPIAVLVVLGGCASTTIISQWADPSLATSKFSRIVVAFQHKDNAFRRPLEDAMAQAMPNATPAYRVLDDEEARDEKRAVAKLKSSGFDAAVVMRIVSIDKETTYVPGNMQTMPGPYNRFGGGWSYGWSQVYDPGYLRTDSIATVGTSVYSLGDEKLVWTSRSETFNPGDSAKLVKDVVAANVEAARKALGR